MILAGERPSQAERVAALAPAARAVELAELWERFGPELLTSWRWWSRPAQRAPEGDWRTWLIMAGRGFGKTRAGAEWVRSVAESNGSARIALVGATMREARTVMVEGESGLLAIAPPRTRPFWEPSLGRLRWPGGAQAFCFSAAEPESLRGPQHHAAWADEIAKWPHGEAAWDNLMLGMRCGAMPQVVATTTPRPVELVRRLVAETGVVRTGGATADNRAHLAAAFVASVKELYGGTRLGRQELDGELIEDVAGSLWPRELIETSRQSGTLPREELRRVVVGVDPPISASGDACGIVVCGVTGEGDARVGYVLADMSVSGLRPEGWARAVVHAADTWNADRVIVENNQGGDMVESVLRSVDSRLPVRTAHARKGKVARAEPVASLFERGKARFAGAFPELEDELAGMTIGGGYEGPGRSPDRADAMVWAMTELMLKERKAEPRIRFL